MRELRPSAGGLRSDSHLGGYDSCGEVAGESEHGVVAGDPWTDSGTRQPPPQGRGVDRFMVSPWRGEQIDPFAVPSKRARILLGVRHELREELRNRVGDLDGLCL